MFSLAKRNNWIGSHFYFHMNLKSGRNSNESQMFTHSHILFLCATAALLKEMYCEKRIRSCSDCRMSDVKWALSFFLAHPAGIAASPADWPAAPKWGEDQLTLLVCPAVGSPFPHADRWKHGAWTQVVYRAPGWSIHQFLTSCRHRCRRVIWAFGRPATSSMEHGQCAEWFGQKPIS